MVGITPDVIVSGVDEESEDYQRLSPSELVIALAIVKAHTVVNSLKTTLDPQKLAELQGEGAVVIGCDSTFEFEGHSLGKPGSRKNAIERCKLIQGKSGVLHTGHCIIDLGSTSSGTIKEYSDIASTRVNFATMSDDEIEAYVESEEPLHVAGGFTLDGLSAPFVRSIEGDWSNVIGLSLPLVHRAITSFGYRWFDFATAGNPHQMGSK
jgi:septum formation protein